MSKAKLASLGVLALLVASGVAASMASAEGIPVWHVKGAKIPQGISKQVKIQSKGAIKLRGENLLGVQTVTCDTGYVEGAAIMAQGQGKGTLVLKQCSAEGTCRGVAEPIVSVQLKSYLAYNPNSKQQKFVDVLEPQQGSTIAELHMLACVVEIYPMRGAIVAEVVPTERESQQVLLSFPEEPITKVIYGQQEREVALKWLTENPKFSAAFGATLAGNELWGAFGT
jgi:hypothetical protein